MRNLTFTLAFMMAFATSFSQIVINEYSAANYNGTADNYGEFEDWFELYNPSGTAIDLNGYFLSDKSDNLTKWQISAPLNILPNNYQMVYCSGRNEIIGTNVHTGYKLHQTKGNEWIILTNPDGITVEDSVWIRPCLTNQSRGRVSDGDLNWGVFPMPNPNNSNIGSLNEYSQKPTFAPIPGYFATNTNITITASAGAQIYYTTDGSLPDNTDNLYTGAVAINTTTVLKAVAYDSDPNTPPSFMTFGTYFIGTSHTMPILSIAGGQVDNLLDGNGWIEPVGTFELYDVDGTILASAVGEFNEHGNDSWAYDQRGFDYITRDQFGYNHAIQHEIFRTKDRDKYQRLIVKAAANDNYPFSYGGSGAHIRDAYVQSLSQVADLRMDERSHESCILYLNGEYWGLYELREKVDDIDFTDYYYDQDSVAFLKTWGGTWADVLTTNQATGPVFNSWDNLVDFITLNDMSDPANYDYVKGVFNTGSLIDYYILNSYIVNADWLNWNTAWWQGLKPDGDKKKWRYVLWDMDNTFDHGANYTGVPNQGPLADPCNPENIGDPGGEGHIPIWNALLNNEEFFDDYINRWSDLSNSYLSCEFMTSHLDSLIAIIEPEMQMQIDRWVADAGGGSYAEWEDNVQEMKDFMEARCAALNVGIVDCYDVEGPFTVTVIINGIGEVQLNSIDIDNLNSPWNGEYFGGVDIDFSIDNGNFSFYEIISSDTYVYDEYSTDFSLDILGDITIIFYFDADEITYVVDPPNTGNINLDGTILGAYPHTQAYPEGTTINLGALPNAGWKMDYWSSNSHTFNPNPTEENVDFSVSGDDTITLHLEPIVYDITFMIDPTLADAELEINGVMVDAFPYTTSQDYGSTLDLEAQSSVTWSFTHWTSNHHITGQVVSKNQSIVLYSSDTIVLHYEENIFYTIAYNVNPQEGGQLLVNNIPINIFPFEQEYLEKTNIMLEAIPNDGWRFSYWRSENNEILPDTRERNTYFSAESDDNIVANFEEIFEVFVPNAFTPSNGDEDHNTFDVSVYTLHDFDYQLRVFNRIGEPLFESTDAAISWDGSHPKTGTQVPSGVYVYLLKVKSLYSGKEIEKKGSITILR